MISVKGMTVCTPEFHAIAKRAEEQARVDCLLERIQDDIDDVTTSEFPLTGGQYNKLADIRCDIEEAL